MGGGGIISRRKRGFWGVFGPNSQSNLRLAIQNKRTGIYHQNLSLLFKFNFKLFIAFFIGTAGGVRRCITRIAL